MKKLVSRMQTPDGTILTSRYTHDYVTHLDKNGELYMLDGGTEYCRMSINNIPAKDVSIYTDSPFEEIREHLYRGTFDKEGNRIWIPLKDMSDNHLFNCIIYKQKELKDDEDIDPVKLQYIKEIAYRNIF